jgi:hypothetical protein
MGQLYAIFRRSGWAGTAELEAAEARSSEVTAAMGGDVTWIRTYVLAEPDGRLGTLCVYEAVDADALRRHAAAAGLPVDEIVPVSGIVLPPQAPPGP